MSKKKCPYCYRSIGVWKKDPILLPDGAKYKWFSDTHLIKVDDIKDREYKGIYQISEPEVQEIQDKLKKLEEERLSEFERTEFSPLTSKDIKGGKFQITGKHIKEMRDSIEKLLKSLGLEKKDYFNYDEDRNRIIHPEGDKLDWTDPITEHTDLQKFQVKAIHIEELRHFIEPVLVERFSKLDNQIITKWGFKGDFGWWSPLSPTYYPETELFGKFPSSVILIYRPPPDDCDTFDFGPYTDQVYSRRLIYGEIIDHTYKIFIRDTPVTRSVWAYSSKTCPWREPGYFGHASTITGGYYTIVGVPFTRIKITPEIRYGIFDITYIDYTLGSVGETPTGSPFLIITFTLRTKDYVGFPKKYIMVYHSQYNPYAWELPNNGIPGIYEGYQHIDEIMEFDYFENLPVTCKKVDLYTHLVQRYGLDLYLDKITIEGLLPEGFWSVTGRYPSIPSIEGTVQMLSFVIDNIGAGRD